MRRPAEQVEAFDAVPAKQTGPGTTVAETVLPNLAASLATTFDQRTEIPARSNSYSWWFACRILSWLVTARSFHFRPSPWTRGDRIAFAVASTSSCRYASGAVAPNTDSPRIPHDKVAKMTDSSHKPLSEGHCRRRAGGFKSSLGHCTNVALTRVNSQSHCRSRGLAQWWAGSADALRRRTRGSEEASRQPARCRLTGPPRRSPPRHRTPPCWRWGTRARRRR